MSGVTPPRRASGTTSSSLLGLAALDGAIRIQPDRLLLSEIPPGTHLLIIPKDAKDVPRPPITTIVRFVKQQGCGLTGNAIAEHYGDKRLVKAFRDNASGIICTIEYPFESTATLTAGLQAAFNFRLLFQHVPGQFY